MAPSLRKLNLTAHVTSSVGWLGAVASFLVLSIAGLTSQDAETVRGAYLAMNVIGLFMIVPLGLAALATGLAQSLGTHWGLFRHYWVLAKFTLTIGAIFLLLLHQFTAVAEAARRVSEAVPGALPDVGRLGTQLVTDAGLAVLVLLVTTTLSVYKPWGKTPYGRRKQQQERREATDGNREMTPITVSASESETAWRVPFGFKVFISLVGLIVAVFVAIHLSGGGIHGH